MDGKFSLINMFLSTKDKHHFENHSLTYRTNTTAEKKKLPKHVCSCSTHLMSMSTEIIILIEFQATQNAYANKSIWEQFYLSYVRFVLLLTGDFCSFHENDTIAQGHNFASIHLQSYKFGIVFFYYNEYQKRSFLHRSSN